MSDVFLWENHRIVAGEIWPQESTNGAKVGDDVPSTFLE